MDYIGRALVADALQEWREQLQQLATVSPLRDLTTSRATTVDLRSAHPSGLAALFAGRPTPLTTLVRDRDTQRLELRRAHAVLEEAQRGLAATGTWVAAIAVGTVRWADEAGRHEMPILLRPVTLERGRDDDLEITLHDEVSFNPVLAMELRSRGETGDLTTTAPAIAQGVQFDPRPIWNAVREAGHLLGDDVEIADRLVLGCFDDPEQRLIADLDDLDSVIGASTMIAAIAGDQDAVAILSDPLPDTPAGDRDPFGERGLGDLDDVQFAALDIIATGRDLFIQSPPGADAIGMAAAVCADAAASGKTVLAVGGHDCAIDALAQRLDHEGARDLYVHGSTDSWDAQARALLLEAITMDGPDVDDDALRAAGQRLVHARRDVYTRFDALHRPHRPWGVSAFEAVQAVVRLTSGAVTPATSVRLGVEAGAAVAEHGFAAVATAISEQLDAADTASTPSAPDAAPPTDLRPWWEFVTEDAEYGRSLDEALATLVVRLVPKMRADAGLAADEIGVDEAPDMATWSQQVDMFERLRATLEIFSPAVFHRSLHDLVAATAPVGSALHTDMPGRDRRALSKRAEDLLRPGRDNAELHEQLIAAHEVAEQWQAHCSTGAWPAIPDDFDAFGDRVGTAWQAWDRIAAAVAQATGTDDLPQRPWHEMVEVLDRLAEGVPGSLESIDTGPITIDLEQMGFGPFMRDLQERSADQGQVRVDLEFAWWAAAFEDMLIAQPQIGEFGALGAAVAEFLDSDRAFADARVGPLMRAVAERRRAAIAHHPELARDLFAALVEGEQVSYRELWRDFGTLVGSLRPVILARPDQVARVAPASRVADVAVVVAGEPLALAELIPTLARARQVVVVGDTHVATRSAVAALAALLPHVVLHALPQRRDPRVGAVLADSAYGRTLTTLPAPPGGGGGLTVIGVDARGEAGVPARAVRSTRAVVSTAVEHVASTAERFPQRTMIVVADNATHARHLAQALHDRAVRLGVDVPVVTLGDAAGLDVDEVVISLGAARDYAGVLPARLGVLSAEWGTQAFTQALVAARSSVTVISALTAADLEAIAAQSDEGHGIGPLRELMLAASESAIVAERPEPAPLDWLLADVARRLRSEGCAARLRYGTGMDSIPMVAGGHGDQDYTVAVVTDESAPTARTSIRDHLRWQYAQLKALGWTVVSLWTVDVFLDPAAAVSQVRGACDDCAAAGVHEAGPSEAVSQPEHVLDWAPAPEPPQELEPHPDAEPEPEPESEPESEPEPGPEPEPESELESDAEPELDPEGEPDRQPELELDFGSDPEPAAGETTPVATPRVTGLGFGMPKITVTRASTSADDAQAPRQTPRRGDDRPLIPTKAWEDTAEGWGDRESPSRDDQLKGDKPPHW